MPGPGGVPVSAAEWKALPTLPIAQIATEQESASVYMVVRVGIVLAKSEDARAAGVASDGPLGMTPLPTVTIQSGDGERLYRLPVELNGWAFDVVGLAHDGRNLFPCEVEFGVLRGEPFAEFVLEQRRGGPRGRTSHGRSRARSRRD